MVETPGITGQRRTVPDVVRAATHAPGDTPLSPSVVTEAVAEVMRASNPGGIVDRDLAARIGGTIRPALEQALGGKVASGSELMASTTFRTILTQHMGSPAGAYVDEQTRKAMQRTLDNANRTDATYAAAERGLEALRLRTGERPVSSNERARDMSVGNVEKSGLTGNEYAALARQFGAEELATAMDQARTLGLSGKQNVALLAEFKEVAGALASGNMDQAWALYNAEKDPEKRKKILTLIQNTIDAKNKNNKELKEATKTLPKIDAERVERTAAEYLKDQNNPKAREAYEKLQEEFKENKSVSKALHEIKKDNDQLKKALGEQQGKNTQETKKNSAKRSALSVERSDNDDVMAALNQSQTQPAEQPPAPQAPQSNPVKRSRPAPSAG